MKRLLFLLLLCSRALAQNTTVTVHNTGDGGGEYVITSLPEGWRGIGAGQTVTFLEQTAGTAGIYTCYYMDAGQTYTRTVTASPTGDGFNGYFLDFTITIGNEPPPTYYYHKCWLNNTLGPEQFTVTATFSSGPPVVGHGTASPGQTFCLDFQDSRKPQSINVDVTDTYFNPDGTVAGQVNNNVGNIGPSDPGWTTSPPSTGAPPTPVNPDHPPTYDGTGGPQPVNFNNPNPAAATEGTLKTGFNALDTTLADGFMKENQQLGAANNFLSQIKATLDANNAASEGSKLDTIAGNTAGTEDKLDTANGLLSRIATATENTADNTAAQTNLQGTANGYLGAVATNTAMATNLLGKLSDTNGVPTADDLKAQGDMASGAVKGQYDALGQQIVAPQELGVSDGDWSVSAMGYTWDLNPVHNGDFAALAVWVRNLVTWGLTFSYILACFLCVEEYVRASTSAQQARSAEVVPVFASGSALAMAAAMTVALAAVPALVFAFAAQQNWGWLGTNPFIPVGGATGRAVALANAFFPLGLMVSQLMLHLAFRVSVGGVYWVATTIVRFLVG